MSAAATSADFSRRIGSPYAWYVVLLLALAHLVSFIDRFVMSLVLTPLKDQFHLSDTQLGLLHGTGFVILYSVASLPLGRLADITNRRNIIMMGLAFWSVATAACGLANSFNSLFAARVAVGLGEAALVPAAMSLIAIYVRRDQVGRAISMFTTGASLGKSVALIAGGGILAWLTLRGGLNLPGVGLLPPWAGVFIIAALPGFALIALLLTVKEPPRSDAQQKKPSMGAAFSYIGSRKWAFASHTIASACVVALVQGVAAWAPTFYSRMFDMTPAAAGVMVGSLFLLIGPAANLGSGWVLDRLQKRGVRGAPGLLMAVTLAAGVPFAIIFCYARQFEISIVAYCLTSACIGAASAPGLAGVQMITPERLRGVVTALFMSVVTFFAVGFGATLIGSVTDNVFKDPQRLNMSMMVVTIVIGSVGALVAWLSRTPTSLIQVDRVPAPVAASEAL